MLSLICFIFKNRTTVLALVYRFNLHWDFFYLFFNFLCVFKGLLKHYRVLVHLTHLVFVFIYKGKFLVFGVVDFCYAISYCLPLNRLDLV